MQWERTLRLMAIGIATPALFLTGGCTSTVPAQVEAKQLAADITAYRAQQKDRIDRVNQEYHDAFTELMDAFVDLTQTQLQQQRDVDAQHIADKIISDDKSTLIGMTRDSFQQTLKNQRDVIANADLAVAAARGAYAKAYADAKLELAKLDKVASNLRALSQPEEWMDELKTATHVIQVVAQSARDAQSNSQVAAGHNTPQKPSVPKAPAKPIPVRGQSARGS